MKYIIDIPDDYIADDNDYGTTLRIPYMVYGGQTYYFGTTITLVPYDETDCENNAWDFVKAIYKLLGANCEEREECFRDSIRFAPEVFDLSYQEAKSKYDAWKEHNDAIHIGDEVQCNDKKMIVLCEEEDYGVTGILVKDGRVDYWDKEICEKTGKHYDDVDKLIEKLVNTNG